MKAKHGLSRRNGKHTPTFRIWQNMKARCTRPDQAMYHRYGGRGIKVCERWMNSFADFVADMGEQPPGKVLDRKNNDGHYEHANCHWVTRSQNQRNMSTNRLVVLSGYRCDLYDELFGSWNRVDTDTVADGARPRRECIWLNDAAWGAQRQAQLPMEHIA